MLGIAQNTARVPYEGPYSKSSEVGGPGRAWKSPAEYRAQSLHIGLLGTPPKGETDVWGRAPCPPPGAEQFMLTDKQF